MIDDDDEVLQLGMRALAADYDVLADGIKVGTVHLFAESRNTFFYPCGPPSALHSFLQLRDWSWWMNRMKHQALRDIETHL